VTGSAKIGSSMNRIAAPANTNKPDSARLPVLNFDFDWPSSAGQHGGRILEWPGSPDARKYAVAPNVRIVLGGMSHFRPVFEVEGNIFDVTLRFNMYSWRPVCSKLNEIDIHNSPSRTWTGPIPVYLALRERRGRYFSGQSI
jgi:hypothetical protein